MIVSRPVSIWKGSSSAKISANAKLVIQNQSPPLRIVLKQKDLEVSLWGLMGVYNSIVNIELIPYEDHSDPLSASLGVLEFKNLKFIPKRAYWLYDFAPGACRGKHAHKKLNQLMVMIKGSLDLLVSDGENWRTIEMLEKANYVFLPSGHWREMRNASTDAVLLVIADSEYLESDYIRSWECFLDWIVDQKK